MHAVTSLTDLENGRREKMAVPPSSIDPWESFKSNKMVKTNLSMGRSWVRITHIILDKVTCSNVTWFAWVVTISVCEKYIWTHLRKIQKLVMMVFIRRIKIPRKSVIFGKYDRGHISYATKKHKVIHKRNYLDCVGRCLYVAFGGTTLVKKPFIQHLNGGTIWRLRKLIRYKTHVASFYPFWV